MKIVFVAHSFPYPLTEGIRVPVYHLLRHLSKRHEVHLLCYVFSKEERKFEKEIAPFCRSMTVIEHPIPKEPWKRIWGMLFQKGPFCLYQFHSKEMQDAIRKVVSQVKPDVVHFDHPPMVQFAQIVEDRYPKVLAAHDSMSLMFRRNAKYETNPARKLYFLNQAGKFQHLERTMLEWFDKTVVLSPVDRDLLKAASPNANIVWHPNGVDLDYFAPRPSEEMDNVILFRGIMDFFPNHDAALYFVEKIFPLILSRLPQTQFWIAGDKPFPALQKKAARESRIRLFGFVSDLREPMGKATVVVSPMRAGSGIKNKILESLAMGKSVVATSASLPGIAVKNEQELIVSDAPNEFAEQVIRLMLDKNLRKKLAVAGRSFVEKNHSWSSHAAFFESIYSGVIRDKAGETPK